MLLVCGWHSFVLLDLDSDEFIKVGAGSRGIENVRLLLFKWFKYHPRKWREDILETSVRAYPVDIPPFDKTNANYNNEQQYYFEYIVTKYNLFGYQYFDKTELI